MKRIDEKELAERLARARVPGLEAEVDAVAEHLRRGSPAELVAIDPARFSRRLGFGRTAAIKAFLHLARAGVLELGWKVRCPHCRGDTQSSPRLASVRHGDHCSVCRVDYKAAFDQDVELVFTPAPAVVELGEVDPFEATLAALHLEPGLSIDLEAGERRVIEYQLLPGNYLLGNADARFGVSLEVAEDAPRADLGIGFRFRGGTPGALSRRVGPGRTRILLENATGEATRLSFARAEGGRGLDAALVTTIQEFRDFFAREVLAADESFSIGELSLVFTDIKGSTEMYERLGDDRAFAIVKEHFAVLERVVREHEGAVVKTIGDAVMAVFSRPADALAACGAMIEAFDEFNAEGAGRDSLVIKVGAHCGPCIAVNLNDRVDYFGTAVNQAARVQGLSDGRDVMVSARLFAEGGAEGLLGPRGWSWEAFSASLKGIREEMRVFKLMKLD